MVDENPLRVEVDLTGKDLRALAQDVGDFAKLEIGSEGDHPWIYHNPLSGYIVTLVRIREKDIRVAEVNCPGGQIDKGVVEFTEPFRKHAGDYIPFQ